MEKTEQNFKQIDDHFKQMVEDKAKGIDFEKLKQGIALIEKNAKTGELLEPLELRTLINVAKILRDFCVIS